MVIKKTVEIEVNTKGAVNEVNKLKDSVEDVKKEAESVDGSSIKNVGDGAKKSTKSVGGLSKGFKGLGLAIKATGIGLLVSVLASLVEGLQENERASKFFKVAFEAVSIVTQDFINFVIDNSGTVIDFFKAIFEDPLGSIEKLGELIKENLIERFKSLLEVQGFVAEAFGKLFEGDFSGAFDSIKEAGKELVDVYTGVDGTVEKVVDSVDTLIEKGSEYGSNVLKQAKSNIELARSAEIAQAQQALLVEQYDRQAEKLRQVRDNDLLSIDERIKANDQLKDVLDKQEQALLAEADAILASAQAQFNKNKSTENEVALLEAKANIAGVLAQTEGLRSEQESNRIALIKERLELENSELESEEQRELRRKEFEASREQDLLRRLELEREILEEEKIIESERLQNKIDSFALGTQARLDAENELKDRLLEIDQEITTNADAQKNARIEIDEKERQSKTNNINKTGEVLDSFSKLAGEKTAEGKVLAVASSTINTFRGVSDALAANTVTPFETALKFANAIAIGASGLANVRDILKVKVPGGKGGGSAPTSSSGGQAIQQQAPAFNLVGQGGVNQIQDSLSSEAEPIKAFVVSGEVTTAQQLERNQIDSATIG